MSTQDIYNHRRVNDQVITAGQPIAEQFADAAREGVQAVINLATDDPGRSLEDEGGLVTSLGMDYYHIPVVWGDPRPEDFAAFEAAMQQLAGRKTLIHCAANFRVTAFYSLYAMKHLGWSEGQADEFRASVWQDSHYPVWEAFIGEMKRRISQEPAGDPE